MKSITIHALDDTLDRLLQEKANQYGTSLNQTIKGLLKEALGISKQQKRFDFSEFSGIWTKKEFKEFERAVKDFEKIDPRDWK